jgi:hypothetical protein
MEGRLVTNYLIALSSDSGKSGRMPIAMLGIRYKGGQKVEITRPMLAEVIANFRKRDSKELPVDYEHASEEPEVAAGGPVPAAGWIKSIDDEPDAKGILWGNVEWTARAASMIQAKEYRYISPFIDPSVRDNKTGRPQGWTLTSCALTNKPVLQGMPALVLSERGWSTGEGQNVNNDQTTGYVNVADWDTVQLEIRRRAAQLMAADRRLDYAAAEDAVYRSDPKLADQDWDVVQGELIRRIKAMMAANNQLTYPAAMQAVMRDDSNLVRRYYSAKTRWLSGADGVVRPGDVALEMKPLIEQKVAASEGRLNYAGAFSQVLSERPDLARRYKDAIR